MDLFERYVGKVIDNRYKIIKIIGSGGMAVVFEAYDTVNNREVALKLLRDDIARDPRAVKRFINESKAISMMSHPNIVKIYAISVRENLKYIVMERVQGITLKNYINKKGALPYREALLYTRQILKALEHAHSKGIVHRDIKPQNIMLLKNGLIKVTDFGIAKLPDGETISTPDKAIGTVYYISPEQAGGKEIDQRSDIYSLGIVMYEMMTGILPFRADTPVSVALKQINEPPRKPREYTPAIPIGVEQVILAAMEKRPERRFQSARQMLECVSKLLEDPNTVFNQRRFSDADKSDAGRKKAAEEKQKKKGAPISLLPIMIALFVGVAVIAVFFFIKQIDGFKNVAPDDNTHQITVENYVMRDYTDDLRETLEEIGYYVDVTYDFSDEYPAGTILKQNPVEGEKKKVIEGKQAVQMKLTVSSGKESYVMPDLTGKKQKNAEIALKPYDIEVEIVLEASEIDKGLVIYTEPEAGQALPSKVILHVSNGPTISKMRVPDFSGKTLSEATNLMKLNDLLVGEVYYENSDVEKDKVIRQSIAPGAEVPASSRIDIVISKGPAPAQTEEDVQVKLEGLAGKDIGVVINKLDALGLKHTTSEEYDGNIPSGYVIRTDPGEGVTVKTGSTVHIVVSKGTDPNASVETPEVTPPPATEAPDTEAPDTDAPQETEPAAPSEETTENNKEP